MRKLNTAVPIQNQVKTVVSTKTCQVKEKGFNCFLSRSPESANHISGRLFQSLCVPYSLNFFKEQLTDSESVTEECEQQCV